MHITIVGKPEFWPLQATKEDRGLDLIADLSEPFVKAFESNNEETALEVKDGSIKIPSNTRALIKTGITVDIDWYKDVTPISVDVRSKSGLALKYGIIVLNSPGTIDINYYPNIIGVILYNQSTVSYTVKHLQRVAQLILPDSIALTAVSYKDWESTELVPFKIANVDAKERIGGFGHTGV